MTLLYRSEKCIGAQKHARREEFAMAIALVVLVEAFAGLPGIGGGHEACAPVL